jgi:hypothetical protein
MEVVKSCGVAEASARGGGAVIPESEQGSGSAKVLVVVFDPIPAK